MIRVEGLTKRYGSREAVQDVSFHVDDGEIVGFLGPNGAGKSTTLRVITGFLAPSAGRVLVDGIDVHGGGLETRRRVGYMPEGVPIYGDMRVREYLSYRAELKGMGRKQVAAAIDRALEQAAVTDAADRIVMQLSKGYRQRVGFADALLTDPPILILDEPSAGLDPNQIRQMRELIRSFAGKKTVFLSTHILPEVEATCDRVVIIREGRKVGEGDPKVLRREAESGTTVRLVSRASEADLRSALERVDGISGFAVDSLYRGGASTCARVHLDGGDELLEAIFNAVAGAGLSLRELTPEPTSLEDIFTELTTIEPESGETP